MNDVARWPRYRLRTWLRGFLPAFCTPLLPKGTKSCGDHEWYVSERLVSGGHRESCYHCVAARDTDPVPPTPAQARRQASILLATVRDFNRGLPELRRKNPELAERILAEQRAVADCRRRAASNRELLDMRLD